MQQNRQQYLNIFNHRVFSLGVFLLMLQGLLFSSFCVLAQEQPGRFLNSGTIYFEKITNQHSMMSGGGEENTWYQEMMKQMPKLIKDEFVLSFSSQKSVYKLSKENTQNKYMWGLKPSQNDVVVQDVVQSRLSVQRDLFEATYLIEDTMRRLEWKITSETREIAGFLCRKAVTRICDSVYVVAFYTDQIPVSAGPESMGGLPGMILGLAVPRLYTTWFATRVELGLPPDNVLQVRQKGKKTGWLTMQNDISKAVKEWGAGGAQFIWRANL